MRGLTLVVSVLLKSLACSLRELDLWTRNLKMPYFMTAMAKLAVSMEVGTLSQCIPEHTVRVLQKELPQT